MNLPKDFESYFLSRWQAEDVTALIRGLEAESSVSIRLNTKRMSSDAMPIGADGRVPWCPEGFYLKVRPSFTADPLLHAGAYYVQEASSMFLAHVLRSLVEAPLSIVHCPFSINNCLDLCAAPGGKSTLLRSLLPDECLLVSNEPNRARCQVLAENLAKWGHPNVLVTQAYASDIAQAVLEKAVLLQKNTPFLPPFDLILADVPCSGEGMMRKEAEAIAQWSPAFVAECASLQRSIVADIWPALRPGGILIYSTCTFNPEEDEENVEWIARELGADVISIPTDPSWGIRGDLRRKSSVPNDSPSGSASGSSLNYPILLPCYHFLPGQVRGEGFFLAVLRKHGIPTDSTLDESAAEESRSSKKKAKKQKGRTPQTPPFPILPTDQLDQEGAAQVELSLTDSIRYLQREALVLPPDTPRGIVQVCYRRQRLGLMNNLGTRANNLYPKEWRIRSSYVTPASLFDPPSE